MKNRRPAHTVQPDPGLPAGAAGLPGRTVTELGVQGGPDEPSGETLGTGGGPGAGRAKQVWLLGNNHPAADRSIGWLDSLPNLNDPDVLVVDLTTMSKRTLERIGERELAHARESIVDKMHHGGTIVVLTTRRFFARRPNSKRCSNYYILPAFLTTTRTPEGRMIRAGADHVFKAYIGRVKKFTFKIDAYQPNATPDAPAGFRKIGMAESPGQTITDNSSNRLGFTLEVVGTGDREESKRVPGTGRLVFLPPPPPESADDAIGAILSVYGKVPLYVEEPPPWAKKLTFAEADQLKAKIGKLEVHAGDIREKIAGLRCRRGEILGHRRLLYAKGPELEAAVASAFRMLGFAAAKQMGGADQADCILDMGTDKYLHGLVEVKGADGRTGERDIVQCGKWVDNKFALDGKLTKAIFVPNQHRKKEYPESSQDRLWFEPNELRYAETKDVCIIPSCVLFEAVKKAMGGDAPDRAEMVDKIAGARGVLERVF